MTVRLSRLLYSDTYGIFSARIPRVTASRPLANGLEIREIKEGDAGPLGRCWPAHLRYIAAQSSEAERVVLDRLRAGERGFACWRGDELVGMAWLAWRDYHLLTARGRYDPRVAAIKNVYVQQAIRKSGIAWALWARCAGMLGRTVSSVHAYIQQGNNTSEAFFSSIGFSRIGKVTFVRVFWPYFAVVKMRDAVPCAASFPPRKGHFVP